MPIKRDFTSIRSAFENGRRAAADRHNARVDCPYPLSAIRLRAAWLDGFSTGSEEHYISNDRRSSSR